MLNFKKMPVMDEFAHLEGNEKLKAENDFLKKKLMLERDISFESEMDNKIPAELENSFLKNVIAFENQYEQQKRIRLFDKIGRPQIFRPVNEIADDGIGKALDDLLSYLSEHHIQLDVCSPNITTRELYRFATEELFEYEMDDMDLPAWQLKIVSA